MEVARLGLILVSALVPAAAQGLHAPHTQPQSSQAAANQADDVDQPAQQHLAAGIALTRGGQFSQAIPHFLAARGKVKDAFAVEFNLALCYVGTRQFPEAIGILAHIGGAGRHAADVDSLLAQAYAGDGQTEPAWKTLQAAAALTPSDEKLYLRVSEACLDEGLYDLDTRVIAIGLSNLPNSVALLFQRGLLRSRLEQTDLAEQDFRMVQTLAPNSDIAYIADAQRALLAGEIPEAIRATRQAIAQGHAHYLVLTMLGEALLRSGVTPASASEFAEAQTVLERAVQLRPGYSGAHISLAKVYLLKGRAPEAIAHLEAARAVDSRNRAIYPALAAAYRRIGKLDQAKDALAALTELNRLEIERIRSATGGHAGYAGQELQQR
jgi:predicted Zn-dependent protease